MKVAVTTCPALLFAAFRPTAGWATCGQDLQNKGYFDEVKAHSQQAWADEDARDQTQDKPMYDVSRFDMEQLGLRIARSFQKQQK